MSFKKIIILVALFLSIYFCFENYLIIKQIWVDKSCLDKKNIKIIITDGFIFSLIIFTGNLFVYTRSSPNRK